MTPRQKAALRAQEIETVLDADTLPAGKRKVLGDELNVICDNMAEGCYSSDPDDGIDWSDCPGVYHGRPYEPEPEYLTFICPDMAYKLYYKNDEGKTTYDDYIPPDIIPAYRDKIEEALEQAYFIRIKHPNVINITPGAEVFDGKLHGTLTVSLNSKLSQDSAKELRDTLTGPVSKWSIYFESQKIPTDGGNLYIRFYDSADPILPETTFNNQAYVRRNSDVFDTVRFYADEAVGCLKMIYYNPDSYAGGQLVQNNLYPDMLQVAFAECKTDEQFWERLDECARQYLTDITSPDFEDESRYFAEQPCDFTGTDRFSMDSIQSWLTRQQEQTHDESQQMNM